MGIRKYREHRLAARILNDNLFARGDARCHLCPSQSRHLSFVATNTTKFQDRIEDGSRAIEACRKKNELAVA